MRVAGYYDGGVFYCSCVNERIGKMQFLYFPRTKRNLFGQRQDRTVCLDEGQFLSKLLSFAKTFSLDFSNA